MALLYSSQVQGQKEIRRESYIETWTYFIWTDARQRPDSCNHLADWLFNFLCDQLSWGPTYICTKQVLKVIHCRWKSLGGFYPGGSEVNLNHLKSVHASNFSGKQVNIADWSIWPHGLKHFTPSLSPDCEGFWVCDSDHPWRIRYSAFQICFYNHMLTQTLPSNRRRGKFLDWMIRCSLPPWCPPRRACYSCCWFLVRCCAVMRSPSYKQVALSWRRGTLVFFKMKMVLRSFNWTWEVNHLT